MNLLKTGLLLTALTLLLVFLGRLVGGTTGMIVGLGLAAVLNFGTWWFSDKIVLARYGAQPVTREEAPQLHAMVERLVARANLPMPRLFVLPEEAPNAFATGRSPRHAAVAVTSGLVRHLGDREVEGVLAHELAHVQNRDTLIMAVAATVVGAIGILASIARWGALFMGGRDNEGGGGNILVIMATAIIAPIAAVIIQLSISRSREYAADRTGARIAGSSRGLASALERLEQVSRQVPLRRANEASAHLFIVNPLRGGLAGLFSTHPPIAERVRRLRQLEITE
jgi:heat shock protein HtpX